MANDLSSFSQSDRSGEPSMFVASDHSGDPEFDGWQLDETTVSVSEQDAPPPQNQIQDDKNSDVKDREDDGRVDNDKTLDEDDEQGFFIQIIQPALEGLMDGSIASLAPLFIAAFTTHQTIITFLVGTGVALSGAISEFISESLSDNEEISERGNPYIRGAVTSLFTFISGMLPTLSFLIPTLHYALITCYITVIAELFIIAIARCKFLRVRWWVSILQVLGGGVLVFVAALLLGNG